MPDFATDGYTVLPGIVPPAVVEAATAAAAPYAADPDPGTRFAFPALADEPSLGALWDAARPAIAAYCDAETPEICQLAMTFPPYPRGPGRPHVDGTVPGPGGRPGTFTLLAGFPLTDQSSEGGLWVWPGSHREHAAHFAARGPDAFWDGDPGYPDVATAAPVQVRAVPGDLVLCHYLLGHCPTGVTTSPRTTVYFRLEAVGHADRWREAMTDVYADYPALRPA